MNANQPGKIAAALRMRAEDFYGLDEQMPDVSSLIDVSATKT